MGFFKRNNETSLEVENNIIKIPQKVDLINNKSLFAMTLESIMDIGDENDLNIILNMLAKKFFIKNVKFIFSNDILKYDDLEIIINLLNEILICHSLGYVQIVINEDKHDIKIFHYKSFFKQLNPDKEDYFFKTFYELFFEKLLDKNVNIEEERSDNEKVIFKIYN